MEKVPVYQHSGSYAQEHNELEQYRASTKDQDSLFALLPFRSLSISGLKDRSGLFAFISRKESRDRPLRLKLSAKLKGAQEKLTAEARNSVPEQRETRQI